MRVLKFEGATMREALADVKAELGPDAVIVSTRKVRRGLRSRFEVSAALEDDPDVVPKKPTPRRQQRDSDIGDASVEKIVAPIRSELRWLRSMLRQTAEKRAADPGLREELRALREIVEAGPARQSVNLAEIAQNNRLARPSEARVVALVGPTGVGKTTSIAKLAAQSALLAGEKVGVITLDGYRIGAEEQMRQYAELIGIPLLVASSPAELATAARKLDSCDRIYVDTAGRSPRDTTAIRSLRRALSTLSGIEVHLTMAAATSPAAMDTIFARYRSAGVARLLLTKLDESDELTELVCAPARLATPVSFIATGQAVPEDLHAATPQALLTLAQRGHAREAA